MHEPVDPVLDLHKGTKRGQVADNALESHSARVFERECVPGIFLDLLHAEGDLFTLRVHLQDHGFDLLAELHHLGWVADVARPAHLRDVHQALDALLQLDERAVVGDGYHPAVDAHADGVALGHILPGVLLELLHAERQPLALPVDVQHLDVDLLPDLHHLGRMANAAPAHVGDVKQAVHTAQVDKRAEVSDVLDHALADLPNGELGLETLPLDGAIFFEQHATRNNDVPAPLVQLDDLELVAVADQVLDVGDPPERDL